MYIIATKEEILFHLDAMYDLACDKKKSAFPSYLNPSWTKDDFKNQLLKSFEREDEVVLLDVKDDFVCGLAIVGSEEGYVYTQGIYSNLNDGSYMQDLMTYCELNYEMSTFHVNMNEENLNACEKLRELKFDVVECACATSLNMSKVKEDHYDQQVISINSQNYHLFKQLQQKYDDKMYWNTERVFAHLDDWLLYAYIKGQETLAVLMTRCVDNSAEVFAYTSVNDDVDMHRSCILTCLSDLKQRNIQELTYFTSKNNVDILKSIGFIHFANYILFNKTYASDI